MIALLFPSLYVTVIVPLFIKPNTEWLVENTIGLIFLWMMTAALLIHVRFFEKRALFSIGLKSIGIKKLALAIGIGLLCSLLIPLVYYVMTFLPGISAGDSIAQVAQRSPLFIMASVVTAACTEEVLFRAYPLERLGELTGSNWLGVTLSLTAFTLLHAQSWALAHILGVVLPLGLILTWIYLKTRSLLFAITVHLVIDLPLALAALIGHLPD